MEISHEDDISSLADMCEQIIFEHEFGARRGMCHPCPRERRLAIHSYRVIQHDKRHDAVLKAALNRWGDDAQTMMACEEAGELIQALMHLRRGRGSPEAVAEEVADLTIMLRQLRIMFGPAMVDSFIEQKMARLQQRVQDSTRQVIG